MIRICAALLVVAGSTLAAQGGPASPTMGRGAQIRTAGQVTVIHLSNDRLLMGPGVSVGAGYGWSDRLSALADFTSTNKLGGLGEWATSETFFARQFDLGARYSFAHTARFDFFTEGSLGWRRLWYTDPHNVPCTSCTTFSVVRVVDEADKSGFGGSVALGFASYSTSRWRVHWAGRRGFSSYRAGKATTAWLARPVTAYATTLEAGVRVLLGPR